MDKQKKSRVIGTESLTFPYHRDENTKIAINYIKINCKKIIPIIGTKTLLKFCKVFLTYYKKIIPIIGALLGVSPLIPHDFFTRLKKSNKRAPLAVGLITQQDFLEKTASFSLNCCYPKPM